jgi:hypothetical protein
MNELDRLNNWYLAQCDGQWENDHGLTLESCDNPGWWLKVDLKETELEMKSFSEVSEGVGGDGHPTQSSWIHCYVRGDKFNGSGDPARLNQIISVFLDWAGV